LRKDEVVVAAILLFPSKSPSPERIAEKVLRESPLEKSIPRLMATATVLE
jgi:hypothetical protein